MFITAVKILKLAATSSLLRVGVYILHVLCVQGADPLSRFLMFSSEYLQWCSNGCLPQNEKILPYSK